MLWASFCDQLLGLSGLKNYIENKNLGYSVKIWISDKLMNVLKIAQICQIWNILELEKCLKFNSNWASCTLSDKPTDGQLQAKKKGGAGTPATGGSHRDRKQKEHQQQIKGPLHWLFTQTETVQEENYNNYNSRCCCQNSLDFLKAGCVSSWGTLSIKVPF